MFAVMGACPYYMIHHTSYIIYIYIHIYVIIAVVGVSSSSASFKNLRYIVIIDVVGIIFVNGIIITRVSS
jgi:hypothetical protein